ncbi:hypothetical protein [Bradyrhizobium hereditatis]|uniref:hypothetical protein n=1 Tax=Bradyrhizobium hereditatis TaxID=2821405 RepID=UPI001CE25439|nr:hypothetical protein [Bradyrhizobium hereditatis]
MDQPGTCGVAARLEKRPGSQYETPLSSAYAAWDTKPSSATAALKLEWISQRRDFCLQDFRLDVSRVICLPQMAGDHIATTDEVTCLANVRFALIAAATRVEYILPEVAL